MIAEDEIAKQKEQFPIHFVPEMNAKEIMKICGKTVDPFVIDPPLNTEGSNLTTKTFQTFLKGLVKEFNQFFIVVWVNPEVMSDNMAALTSAGLRFCDSISVELINGESRPEITILEEGIRRQNHMLVMYSTDNISRTDLTQQQIKDTGWGLSIDRGKNYSRPSMPLVPHHILETMLPPRANNTDQPNQRVFVDLWSSYFHHRDDWILIDEEPVIPE